MRGGSSGAAVLLGGGAKIDVAASRRSRIKDGVILWLVKSELRVLLLSCKE